MLKHIYICIVSIFVPTTKQQSTHRTYLLFDISYLLSCPERNYEIFCWRRKTTLVNFRIYTPQFVSLNCNRLANSPASIGLVLIYPLFNGDAANGAKSNPPESTSFAQKFFICKWTKTKKPEVEEIFEMLEACTSICTVRYTYIIYNIYIRHYIYIYVCMYFRISYGHDSRPARPWRMGDDLCVFEYQFLKLLTEIAFGYEFPRFIVRFWPFLFFFQRCRPNFMSAVVFYWLHRHMYWAFFLGSLSYSRMMEFNVRKMRKMHQSSIGGSLRWARTI